ncbi:unnamed protein product [Parascedosporium putredinis]|uniref:Uncharacterized protein n=1 Tax=Parascedosporium putredinis TaxID=1442378 RepID=A0A9P1HAY1_9PEZI|nr:unnamed protein product [Parascedosporium putredinis]CAI8002200.1 unnamed protein product [Parascedosporium putredinis]
MNNQPPRGSAFDRDREIIDQRQRAADQMAHREREQNERTHREPYHPSVPHHSTAGSIPIHQPVASRLPGAIHSPGGLLANHGSTSAIPLGAPSGPVATFGGPLHEQGNRPPAQHGPQNNPGPQHQMFGPMTHGADPRARPKVLPKVPLMEPLQALKPSLGALFPARKDSRQFNKAMSPAGCRHLRRRKSAKVLLPRVNSQS